MKLPQVIEINGIRVLTTEQLARNYGTQPKILQYNFLIIRKDIRKENIISHLQGEELKKF